MQFTVKEVSTVQLQHLSHQLFIYLFLHRNKILLFQNHNSAQNTHPVSWHYNFLQHSSYKMHKSATVRTKCLQVM